jgi:hypothetical protein
MHSIRLEIFKGDIDALWHIASAWSKEGLFDSFGLSVAVDIHLDDLARLINSPDCDLIVAWEGETPIGYMGIVKFKSPIGTETIASEHYWYILPQYRGRAALQFIRAAKSWAREQGCSHLQMTASRLASELHDQTCRIYEALRMKHFETTYICRL